MHLSKTVKLPVLLQAVASILKSVVAPAVLSAIFTLQAQRDFFGSHTYQRTDKEGWFHTVWDENFGSADSITTSGYVA